MANKADIDQGQSAVRLVSPLALEYGINTKVKPQIAKLSDQLDTAQAAWDASLEEHSSDEDLHWRAQERTQWAAKIDALTQLLEQKTQELDVKIANAHYTALPIGSIILWSGDLWKRPNGFEECNGFTYNGIKTPNLKGRFAMGVGGDYSGFNTSKVGATGGAASFKLGIDHIPEHEHSFQSRIGAKSGRDVWIPAEGNGWSIPTSSAGRGQSYDYLPPYSTVYYLMKVR